MKRCDLVFFRFLFVAWLALCPALSSATTIPLTGAGKPSASTPATISFTANAQQTGSTSTCTFSSQAIGTATADRIIAVGASIYQNPAVNINSVTVGGISATSQVAVIAGTFIKVQIWTAAVPTGTTANVVVTLSGTTGRCAIGVWAMYGLTSATATATATSTSNPATAALTINAGGVAVGYDATAGTGTTPTFLWTLGLTEDFDATADAGVIEGHTGASAASTPGASINPVVTPSTFNFGGLALAAFR